MILLREARENDLDALLRFAQIPGMFNLPAERDTLRDRIVRSRDSFSGALKALDETKYTFIAEDLAGGGEHGPILATSMIAGQHGTPDSPHFYFEVGHEKRFSQTINTGFIHGTLTLGYDTDGPSEIGALVVDPEYRNHESRVGRQISFVRFLYVALHRARFRPWILAELLPPLNKRGRSPLWEAIGRRFTNMDYWEADQLCAKNKDFIFDLFPSGKIYTTFLPTEARNALGKVGKDTEPVFHMLKKIGFEYRNQIDPFDGGPHLWGRVEQLGPIRHARKYTWKGELAPSAAQATSRPGLIYNLRDLESEVGFRAAAVEATVETTAEGERLGVMNSSKSQAEVSALSEALGLRSGDEVFFMPYY
jgi:arginine N-succinyltransferase